MAVATAEQALEFLPTEMDASVERLVEIFKERHQPREQHRIGAESEKIAVQRDTLQPLSYEGELGVVRILQSLRDRFGWSEVREAPDRPLIALTRAGANITLEPSAQLELSGAPHRLIADVVAEQREHLHEIQSISEEMGLAWLMVGFHPTARLQDLSWVPKLRYPIMREYLPTQGHEGLNMMQRTATVQANFDYESESDALRKMQVALKLSPLIHALFANSPFYEGGLWEGLSRRGEVWRFMDPRRSGLIPALWQEGASYADYVRWALQAGMFLFKREGRVIQNTGQSFADFIEHGFEGERATVQDFQLHLTTLFPEVRLKNTIEVRPNDGLCPALAMACVALWTGLLYDETSLAQAAEWLAELDVEQVNRERHDLVRQGLAAQFGGKAGWPQAEKLLSLAQAGLERREPGAGRFLQPIVELAARREHPADLVKQRYLASNSLVQAAALDFSALG